MMDDCSVEEPIEGMAANGDVPNKQCKDNEGRNRASPHRLITVNDNLSQDQKNLIHSYDLGGLLKIAATTLPLDYSRWILQKVDPDKSCIVVEGQGQIIINPDSVTEVLGLPNRGEDVFYGMDAKATEFMNNLYGLGSAPEIKTFCKMIEDMKGKADDNFMRAWITLTVTCFLCPTTSLCVSLRCYPMVVDLEKVKRSNFAKFVHDQIMIVVSNMKGTKKKSVSCCVHHLVVKYVDSLVVDFLVPSCKVRAEAWDSKRIAKVIKANKKPDGGFGRLRLKPSVQKSSVQKSKSSLFVGYAETERFISSRLPSDYSPSKKRKLAEMASQLCKLVSDQVCAFIEGVGKLHAQGPVDTPRKKKQRVTSKENSSRGAPGEDDDDDADDFVAPVRHGTKRTDGRFKAQAPTYPKHRTDGVTKKPAPTSDKAVDLPKDDLQEKAQASSQNRLKEEQKVDKTDKSNVQVQAEQCISLAGPNAQVIGTTLPTNVANQILEGSVCHRVNLEPNVLVQQATNDSLHTTFLPIQTTHHEASPHIHEAVPLCSVPQNHQFLHTNPKPLPGTHVLMDISCGTNIDMATTRTGKDQLYTYQATNEHDQATTSTVNLPATKPICIDPPAAGKCSAQTPTSTKCARFYPLTETEATGFAQESVTSKLPTTPAAEPVVHAMGDKPASNLRRSPRKTGKRVIFESASINLNSLPRGSKCTENIPIQLDDSFEDEEWDLAILSQAEADAKKVINDLRNMRLNSNINMKDDEETNVIVLKTPETRATPAKDGTGSSSSNNQAGVGHERRVVRAPVRTPFVDPANTNPFFCSKDVENVYNCVCQHVKRRSR